MAGKGDRSIYLEQTHDYKINPRKAMFMTYGTRHHEVKEVYSSEHGEKSLGGSAGTIDDFEEDTGVLYDYKFTGSGKLNRMALKIEVPTGEYYKIGKKKGTAKVALVVHGFKWEKDDSWVLQINKYRIGMEELGYEVKKMVVEATLRDGGTYMAFNSGFHENVYMIEVPFLDDASVIKYYEEKHARIEGALRKAEAPPLCTEEERWSDEKSKNRRCKYYCDVADQCFREGGWKFSELKQIVKDRRK